MEWKTATPEQKAQWITDQIAEIHRAQELLVRFEKLSQNWLKKIQVSVKK